MKGGIMDAKIIKITPDKDGVISATLYGKVFDLTTVVGKDGRGEFKAFGKTYQFEVVKSKSAAKRKELAKTKVLTSDELPAHSHTRIDGTPNFPGKEESA
jgi:hypothetical protein